MKKARFNANGTNSEKLRNLQKDYEKSKAPLRVSLETLANLAIEYGIGAVRKTLGLQ